MSDFSKRAVSIVAKDADGKILMQFRDSGGGLSNPQNALKWSFFGGHYEEDESPTAALVREFEEETTILIEEGSLSYIGKGVYNETEISLYACDRTVGWEEITVREGAGAGFFTRTELDQLPLTNWGEALIRELLR